MGEGDCENGGGGDGRLFAAAGSGARAGSARGGDATEGGRRNAGIGEAVTMTTVTGEVLVRIRDHAYVTTP
jgi:hypothetical protein